MAQPDLILTPFGEDATTGTINDIPESKSPSDPAQAASWATGFPLITMTYPDAGGLPPYGQDVNGVLRAISRHSAFLGGGGQYKWSAAYVAKNGGYSQGHVIQANNGLNAYVSLVDNNTTDFNATPGSIGVSWSLYSGQQLITAQATEASPGVARIATTTLAQAGANDTDMMTPLKTRQAIDNLAPAQATEIALGIARISTTSEAQSGGNDTKIMTPLKVRQAIDNLLPVQATTAAAGIAKLATAAQAIAGTDGISIITPALLKQLFPKRSFAVNDFIRIPDVPGGLIIQFGIGMSYPDISVIQNLPTPFPNALLTCGAQTTESWTGDVTIRFIPAGDKKSSFYLDNSYTTSGPAYYWAIGY